MTKAQYEELLASLKALELQLAVIVGIMAENQRALLDKMEEISGRTPYYGSYS